jgi:hypothetical protein
MNRLDVRRTLGLRTYLRTFKHTDRRSINNSFFIGQSLLKLPKFYTDFENFGRLGVSSFRLNWDYSNLRMNWREETHLRLPRDEHSRLAKVGSVLSNYSSEDLQLLGRYFYSGSNSLSSSEKKAAEEIKKDLMSKL